MIRPGRFLSSTASEVKHGHSHMWRITNSYDVPICQAICICDYEYTMVSALVKKWGLVCNDYEKTSAFLQL